jgi:ribosomal protein L37AE/L43A
MGKSKKQKRASTRKQQVYHGKRRRVALEIKYSTSMTYRPCVYCGRPAVNVEPARWCCPKCGEFVSP